MKILKLLFLIIGLLSMATLATNAYLTDRVTVSNSQFSAGTWEN